MSASPGPRTPRGTPARKVSVPFVHSSPASTSSTSLSKAQPLGRDHETTYHRRFRTILQDHCRARDAWQQLVSFEGIKAARALSVAWEDVDNARATPVASGMEDGSASIEATWARDKATAIALQYADSAREDLEAVMVKIQAQSNRLITVLDQARLLLAESLKAKGFAFVGEEPLWTTWNMDRFVQALADSTTPYVVSTVHLTQLARTLSFYARDPFAEAGEDDATDDSQDATLGVPISALSLFSTTGDGDANRDAAPLDGSKDTPQVEPQRKRAIKAHNGAIQAWARLPHLDEEPGHFLNEICEVEVGRWTERQ
ncbi:hypothetical protein V8E36_000759 [Tilletia maclaganii]